MSKEEPKPITDILYFQINNQPNKQNTAIEIKLTINTEVFFSNIFNSLWQTIFWESIIVAAI